MANVVIYDPIDPVVPNKVILYLLSVNTPDYIGQPNTLINPNIPEVVQKYWKVDNNEVIEMNASEKNAIDLPSVKLAKIAEIQSKTELEEAKGVPYNNYHFSITASAKTNWLAIVMVKDTLTYPFAAPTGFDAIYSFQNANDVLGFFGASMSYLQYWEQSNEQLQIAVNSCTTCAEVEAIVDDRTYPPN